MYASWKIRLLPLALCLLGSSHAAPSASPPPLKRGNSTATQAVLPEFVFYGSGMDPDSVRSQGGILPESVDRPPSPASFSLYNHAKYVVVDEEKGLPDTAYAPTSISFQQAAKFAAILVHRGWRMAESNGCVFRIHVTPNMIDLSASLLHHNPFPEELELSAMFGIVWKQIHGWICLPEDYDVPSRRPGKPTDEDFQQLIHLYEENDQYDPKFNDCVASGGQPQLAGLPDPAWNEEEPWRSALGNKSMTLMDYGLKFMAENGAVVGWKGQPPLIRPPKGADAIKKPTTYHDRR